MAVPTVSIYPTFHVSGALSHAFNGLWNRKLQVSPFQALKLRESTGDHEYDSR